MESSKNYTTELEKEVIFIFTNQFIPELQIDSINDYLKDITNSIYEELNKKIIVHFEDWLIKLVTNDHDNMMMNYSFENEYRIFKELRITFIQELGDKIHDIPTLVAHYKLYKQLILQKLHSICYNDGKNILFLNKIEKMEKFIIDRLQLNT